MSFSAIVRMLAIAALVLCPSCGSPQAGRLDRPRLRVLGTVQDGGLPHAGCSCTNCRSARSGEAPRRFVAGLALLIPRQGDCTSVYLIDASPDLRDQLPLLDDIRRAAPTSPSAGPVDRDPIDGILLTHAHMGHYLGLAQLGFEALNTREIPVYGTSRMVEFLRANGPWSQLVTSQNILPNVVSSQSAFCLPVEGDSAGRRVVITPIHVPHRDEYTDTVAYLFRAGTRSGGPATLYVPDTEPWRSWEPRLIEVIEAHQVETLIVDGTFYSADELPGRPPSTIGHPLMTDTMNLLESRVGSGRLRVVFTHLNHSNPVLDADSQAAREVGFRGFSVAREGDEYEL